MFILPPFATFDWASDPLVKHYALDHFKEKLESELGSTSKDFVCSICKTKKLKSRFDSRQELLLHNAGFHSRAQVLLSEALGDNSKDSNSSNPSSNNTRASRTRNRAKQKSEDSVIEIESNSGSSIGSQNGLEELSEASENTDTIDLEEEEEEENGEAEGSEDEEDEGEDEGETEEILEKVADVDSMNEVTWYLI